MNIPPHRLELPSRSSRLYFIRLSGRPCLFGVKFFIGIHPAVFMEDYNLIEMNVFILRPFSRKSIHSSKICTSCND